MTRPWLTTFAALLIALTAACSDDASGQTGDTGAGDTGNDSADTGNGGDVTGDGMLPDAAGDSAGDVVDEVVERTCGRPSSQDETVSFDVLSPLAEFVGVAEVSKSGLDVSVVIPDPDDPENPTTFEGSFEAGTRCVAAQYEQIDANLCFFNADGSPAEAETLGAQIFAFIAGGQTDRPNATLLGGVRRELDLSCSPVGFYALDTSGLTETGNLPEEVAPFVTESLLDYLALFEIGNGAIDTAMGDVPTIERALSADATTGAIEVEIVTGIEVEVGEGTAEYDVTIGLDGSVNLETGVLSGTLAVTIEGDDDEGSLSGSVTGQRD